MLDLALAIILFVFDYLLNDGGLDFRLQLSPELFILVFPDLQQFVSVLVEICPPVKVFVNVKRVFDFTQTQRVVQ